MRLKPLPADTALADPKRRLLAGYIAALADLAHPKQALRTLEDLPRLKVKALGKHARMHPGRGSGRIARLHCWWAGKTTHALPHHHFLKRLPCHLQAFQGGIMAALQQQQPGAFTLVLGTSGGLLPLLAAQAGTGQVAAVERSRMLYRMARQVLESNRGSGGDPGAAGRVCLLDRRLQAVAVRGEALPPDAVLARQQMAAMVAAAAAAGGAEQPAPLALGDDDVASWLPSRASVLVTDMLDHAVLGQGLLPALDYAADHLLERGATVVPAQADVYACLLELRVGEVSGFDLSALNAYWWHPGAGGERVELGRLPHRRLSAPFRVACLDMQARVDARLAAREAGSSAEEGGGQADTQSETGSSGGAPSASGSEEGSGSASVDAGWELDVTLEVPVVADGHWNAVAFWFELSMERGSSPALTSWADGSAAIEGSCGGMRVDGSGQGDSAAGDAVSPVGASSWDQAVQYVDSRAVLRGQAVRLRARHDAGQFVFTSDPPQCRPRHALGERAPHPACPPPCSHSGWKQDQAHHLVARPLPARSPGADG